MYISNPKALFLRDYAHLPESRDLCCELVQQLFQTIYAKRYSAPLANNNGSTNNNHTSASGNKTSSKKLLKVDFSYINLEYGHTELHQHFISPQFGSYENKKLDLIEYISNNFKFSELINEQCLLLLAFLKRILLEDYTRAELFS
jgi:hypothetical protein